MQPQRGRALSFVFAYESLYRLHDSEEGRPRVGAVVPAPSDEGHIPFGPPCRWDGWSQLLLYYPVLQLREERELILPKGCLIRPDFL